jgi:hypothetical protein
MWARILHSIIGREDGFAEGHELPGSGLMP